MSVMVKCGRVRYLWCLALTVNISFKPHSGRAQNCFGKEWKAAEGEQCSQYEGTVIKLGAKEMHGVIFYLFQTLIQTCTILYIC